MQMNLPGVPKAKQGREVPPKWEWTEASVWTERMLAALEKGVKGSKWFSLMDKVWKTETLQSAMQQVVRNQGAAGVDGQSCEAFLKASPEQLPRLQDKLKQRTYRPKPVKRVWIPKLGSKELRPLGIPTVESRVVETALRNVLEPIFECTFAEHSYGFRPRHGAKQALRRVDQLLKSGHCWVVDADIKGYFDSIPQDKMMEAIETQIADGAVLELLRCMLEQGVMESGKGWQPTETGTPQGAVISPLLANIYLNPLDHMMAQQGWQMVRYADDFVILCQNQHQAQEVIEQLRQWTQAAGLTLHPTKTRIVDACQKGGFDFLGYHFERGHRWPRKKSLDKFKDTIREKTHSGRPASMKDIVREINYSVRGWFEYFKHSQNTVFKPLDGWIRQRLRRILRRRRSGSRRTACRDYRRWPVAYFAKLGLISLALVRDKASQAPHGAH
jgi:RNA-directed DNA polymerase